MSPCPRGTISYRIKSGDTFATLARRFNTSVEAITLANSAVKPKNLQVDQSICIPIRRSIVSCPPGNRYVIQVGDSFSKISQRYGLSLDVLISLNPGVNPSNLQIGQIICVPRRRRRQR